MTVGTIGLGLIGGSFAKAYHAAGWTVYGYDVDESMLAFAQLADAVNAPLTMENIGACDLVLLCVRPLAAIDYLREAAPHIGGKPVVIDCCGTKRVVCKACFPLAESSTASPTSADTRWQARTTPASNMPRRPCTTVRRWCSSRRIIITSNCSPA